MRALVSRVLLVSGSLLPAALLGCHTETGVRDGPDLAVQRLDLKNSCYISCGSTKVDPAVAAMIDDMPECPSAGADCTFAGGTDQIRVIADYADLAFPSCGQVDLPVLSVLTDDADPTSAGAMVPGCGPERRYFAYRRITAPISDSRTVRFRVSSGDAFLSSSEPFTLGPGSLELVVEACTAEDGTPLSDCKLVAGVDSSIVTVRVPASLAVQNEKANIVYSTGQGTYVATDIDLRPSGEHEKVGSLKIAMPNEPDQTLLVRATAGSLASPSRSVTLVAPGPLELSAAVPAAEPGELVKVAAGEPDAACRKVAVTVRAPDGAPNNEVQLQTSQGAFENGGATVTKDLFLNGDVRQATAFLDVPKSPQSQSVVLFASEAGMGSTVPPAWLTFELARTWPLAASLAVATKQVELSEKGSPEVTIIGFALPPKPSTEFQSDTRLYVVVTATSDPMTTPPCGATVATQDLACDATDPAKLPGGCLLTATSTPLSPTGEFGITLASGICFAGKVEVDVYSTTYESTDEPCLADRMLSSAPKRLTSGPVLTLEYK